LYNDIYIYISFSVNLNAALTFKTLTNMEKNYTDEEIFQIKFKFLKNIEFLQQQHNFQNNKFFMVNEIADLATMYNYIQSTKSRRISPIKPLILSINQYHKLNSQE